MLRYKKKVDFEAIFIATDRSVAIWRELEQAVPEDIRREFRDKLTISLIYHDAALEGEVLTHSEIKASIDKSIISDASLIPSYEDINNFNNACVLASGLAQNRRKAIKLETIKDLHAVLYPPVEAKPNSKPNAKASGKTNGKTTGIAYRKENPLHRLYYHDISPPEKIAYRMRKLGEWLDKGAAKNLHPVERAARMHWELMGIFPWTRATGRTARIAANLILEHERYPMAVIHSIDRQRYYESLKAADHRQLLLVYLEAVETTAKAAVRVYEEAWDRPRSSRRRAS